MSQPERSSHWQFLVDLLGAKPKAEAEPPQPAPSVEGSQSDSASEVDEPSLPESAAGERGSARPQRAEKPPKPEPKVERPARQQHWGQLARSFGIEIPEVSEEQPEVVEERETVSETRVPAAETRETVVERRERVSEAREAPTETRKEGTSTRSANRWESKSATSARRERAEEEPARDSFLDDLELVDDRFSSAEEATSDASNDVGAPTSEEGETRSGSRRRRRGRQRRRRETPEPQEQEPRRTEPGEDEFEPALESPPEDSPRRDRSAREEPEEREPDRDQERSAEPRRRRRRRGGQRRPVEPATDEMDDRGPRPPAERPAVAERAPMPLAESVDEDREVSRASDEDEDLDEDRSDERRTRRNIPSWSEAIQEIVNHNIAGRQKSSRRPRGGRGRRPQQRDR